MPCFLFLPNPSLCTGPFASACIVPTPTILAARPDHLSVSGRRLPSRPPPPLLCDVRILPLVAAPEQHHPGPPLPPHPLPPCLRPLRTRAVIRPRAPGSRVQYERSLVALHPCGASVSRSRSPRYLKRHRCTLPKLGIGCSCNHERRLACLVLPLHARHAATPSGMAVRRFPARGRQRRRSGPRAGGEGTMRSAGSLDSFPRDPSSKYLSSDLLDLKLCDLSPAPPPSTTRARAKPGG